MQTSVTLTYDLTSNRTTVAEYGARPFRCIEPDGILGACSTGSLYSRCGWTVTFRVVRSRVVGGRA